MNMKSRTVTYYYPEGSNPSSLKVFQDRSSQIRAFSFKRGYLNSVSKEDYASNYGVYFLLGKNPGEGLRREIYVGQSKLGTQRIASHYKNKDFWEHCIMFVSDNNIFDANAIDYMEYYFINIIDKSSNYILNNVDKRVNEPNLNCFDKITYHTYISQIEFLLNAEGVEFIKGKYIAPSESLLESIDDEVEKVVEQVEINNKTYYPKNKEYNASLEYRDGKYYLLPGSVIHKPKETMLAWSDGGGLYRKLTSEINLLLEENKLVDLGNTCEVAHEVEFRTPSGAGSLIIGRSVNGWSFFKDIEEIRS